MAIYSGDIFAENYTVASSVTNVQIAASSGSTKLGDSPDDTHQFTGSLHISGSGISFVAGTGNTFFGTGALSQENRRSGKYYLAVCKTVGTSSFSIGDIIALDGGSQTITVNGPTNTSVTFKVNFEDFFNEEATNYDTDITEEATVQDSK